MTATLKVSIFLIIVGLIGKAILSDTQPITDDPCDYKECPICPFPFERHKQQNGSQQCAIHIKHNRKEKLK